jgi:hypothetical protein
MFFRIFGTVISRKGKKTATNPQDEPRSAYKKSPATGVFKYFPGA